VKVQDEFRDIFTAALTHDFRGPLAGALNHLQILQRAVPGDGEPHARRAAQNLQRISRMVDRLLDVSRTNAGQKLAIDVAECEVRTLIDETVADLEPRRRQRVRLDNPASITAWWDCEMMHRAVENLLDNALKYSPPDSPISVRVVEVEDRVHIAVHNEGDPISVEDQENLFLPFQRASVARRSSARGWGLGLMQVQAIAEAHTGAVIVESTPEDGTTFTLDVVRDARVARQ
jgi:signal transduction histidine kinase